MIKFLILFLGLALISGVATANAEVPDWVKNTAGWWASDAISEKEFVNAIQFLVNQGIIEVSASNTNEKSGNTPDWVKNTAGWWASDAISEKEFVNAIQFLVNVGIINVESTSDCENDLSSLFSDSSKINDICSKINSIEYTELIPYEVELIYTDKGFRIPEFSEEKPSDVYRVFMLGGSTMVSTTTTNDFSIPRILNKIIDYQTPNSNIEIINAGIVGSNSKLELELIKSELINYDPDLIILYDGWNDLSADYSVLEIIANYASVCYTASQNNFDVIITLQPLAGFGNKSLTLQEKVNSLTGEDHNGYQLLQAKSTYDWLGKELESLVIDSNRILGNNVCNYYDLRDAFDDTTGPIYYDQGHMSDLGNLILADRFLKELSKTHSNIFTHNEKFHPIVSKYNHPSLIEPIFTELGIDVDVPNTSFKDISTLEHRKGNYFQQKEKFGIEGILTGKDLRNVDLNTLDLSGKNLSGANLSGKDLRNVDLSNTIIRGSDLSYTNLEGKNLFEMDIRGINFSYANLRNIDFSDTTLSKTVQGGGTVSECSDDDQLLHMIKVNICKKIVGDNETIRTNFSNSNLENAKFEGTDQILNFLNFSNANLSNTTFTNVEILSSDFSNANLSNSKFRNIGLIGNNFNNSFIDNHELYGVWIQSSSFENSILTNGVITKTFLMDVNLDNADLKNTVISEHRFYGNSILTCKNNDICQK